MFLSYFFQKKQSPLKEQLPLKEQFLQNMKAINNFCFIKLLSKEDIKECSKLQPHIQDGKTAAFNANLYASQDEQDKDIQDFCPDFFTPSNERQ